MLHIILLPLCATHNGNIFDRIQYADPLFPAIPGFEPKFVPPKLEKIAGSTSSI